MVAETWILVVHDDNDDGDEGYGGDDGGNEGDGGDGGGDEGDDGDYSGDEGDVVKVMMVVVRVMISVLYMPAAPSCILSLRWKSKPRLPWNSVFLVP